MLINQYLKPCVEFVSSNPRFDNREFQLLNRIYTDCEARFKNNNDPKDIDINRYRFTQFIKQYDYRRNKNFLQTFPEMEDFWELCLKS